MKKINLVTTVASCLTLICAFNARADYSTQLKAHAILCSGASEDGTSKISLKLESKENAGSKDTQLIQYAIDDQASNEVEITYPLHLSMEGSRYIQSWDEKGRVNLTIGGDDILNLDKDSRSADKSFKPSYSLKGSVSVDKKPFNISCQGSFRK